MLTWLVVSWCILQRVQYRFPTTLGRGRGTSFYASVLLSASARASYWPSATLKKQEDFTFLEGFMVEDVWLEYLKYMAVGQADVLHVQADTF